MPQFPWGDDHWASAAGFCIDAGLLSQHALAPLEFGQLSQSFKPMIYSHFDQATPPDVLVVHKGLLSHYDSDLLFAFRQAGAYVYGNSVFVILTRDLGHKQEGPSEHITVLDRYIENGTSENAGSHADNTWFFDRWQRHERRPDLPIGDGKRIAIVSANRMGNFGDDLLTFATRNILLQAIEGSDIRVLAPPVEKEALTSIDCLVIGAGGLLYDGSLENVLNYMQPVALAAKAAIKTVCLGQGVQGISTPLGRDIFRRALSTCAGLTTRDAESTRVLTEEVGVTCSVQTLQDLAFSLGPHMDAIAGTMPPRAARAKPRVLVSLSDPQRLGAIKSVGSAAALTRFGDVNRWFASAFSKEFDLKFFVQSRDDLAFYQSVRASTDVEIVDPNDAPVEVGLRQYLEADLVLTSRLHGLILACLARKPVIAVSSRGTKIDRLISESIPSLRDNLIFLADYSADALKAKIDMFTHGRLPSISEEDLERAIEKALETIPFVRDVLR